MSELVAHLVHSNVDWIEKVVRTLAVYGFLLAGIRIAGKRELGQLNQFDLVVLLLLSNTVQNAIIGDDNSLVGGMLGAAVLIAANYLVIRYLYRHEKVDALLEGSPELLIERGKVVERSLAHTFITRAELEAAARRQGIDDLTSVDTARLEVSGAITFVPRKPTADELRHREIMDRLAAIERQLHVVMRR